MKKKAVALRYDEGKVPYVVAKGKGEVANKIIEIAKEEGIPIIEDKNLTEALIKVDLYEEIPPELYEVVAKILVYILKKMK